MLKRIVMGYANCSRQVGWSLPLITALALLGPGLLGLGPSVQSQKQSVKQESAKKGSARQESPQREQVWSGYLYRREGKLRIGWGVLAMGVMAVDAHVIAGELGTKLTPFASNVASDYFFWNYAWLAGEGGSLRKTKTSDVPRTLVKLRGVVETDRRQEEWSGFSGGERRLTKGRLLEIEFLSDAWLLAWRALTSDRFNPYWRSPESKIESDREKIVPLVHDVVDALLKMRALSKVTPAQMARAKAIDARAKAVNAHQRQMENMALRWVHRMVAKHGIEVERLGDLGELPPTQTDVQNWFIEAKDKAALIARIRKTFGGDLRDVQLANYDKNAHGGISWVVTTMSDVAGWSDALFAARQKLTRETLRR